MPTYSGLHRVATKHGQIIDKPASMPSANRGPFFPHVLKGEEIPNWPHSIWHTQVIFSTDHASGAGGVWVYACNGDPKLAASWQAWDDISGNDEFAYMFTDSPSTPTVNPVFVDSTAGHQTESLHRIVIDNEIIMTYHNSGNATYDGHDKQHTAYATSADGINYTRQDILLAYNPRWLAGDGHTGYARGYLNPFPHIPHTYIMRSLHGGGGYERGSHKGIWVSNDYKSGWEIHTLSDVTQGRVVADMPATETEHVVNVDIANAVKDGPYWRVIGSKGPLNPVSGGGGSGALTYAPAETYEFLIDEEFNVVSQGALVAALDSAGSGGVGEARYGVGQEFEYDGTTYAIDFAQAADESNVIVISTLNETSYDWEMLAPYNTDKQTELDVNFGGIATLPNSVTLANGSESFTADAMKIAIPPNDGVSQMYSVAQYAPADYDVIDFVFEGLSIQSLDDAYYKVGLRTGNETVTTNIGNLFVAMPNDFPAYSPVEIFSSFVSAGHTASTTVTRRYIGRGTSWTVDEKESPQARKQFTIRIIASKNQMILMNGPSEYEIHDLTGWDFTAPLNMYIHGINRHTSNIDMSVTKMSVVTGSDAAPTTSDTIYTLNITSKYQQRSESPLTINSQYTERLTETININSAYQQRLTETINVNSAYQQRQVNTLSIASSYNQRLTTTLSIESAYLERYSGAINITSVYLTDSSDRIYTLNITSKYLARSVDTLNIQSKYNERLIDSLNITSSYKQREVNTLSIDSAYQQREQSALNITSSYQERLAGTLTITTKYEGAPVTIPPTATIQIFITEPTTQITIIG